MESLAQQILNQLCVDYGIGRKNRGNSYYSLLPKLSEKRNLIFSCIYLGAETSYEIEDMTGICLRTIAGRICELRNDGYIIEAGSKKSKYGKNNTIYKVAPQYEQQSVNKEQVKKAINEFKEQNENKKTYTLDQISMALSQQNINQDSINQICQFLNSL